MFENFIDKEEKEKTYMFNKRIGKKTKKNEMRLLKLIDERKFLIDDNIFLNNNVLLQNNKNLFADLDDVKDKLQLTLQIFSSKQIFLKNLQR